MESYVHMLLTAQASRQPDQTETCKSVHLDDKACQHFDEDDDELVRSDFSNNEAYLSQCASACSSESAANSFDMRIYPLTPCHQVRFTNSNSLLEKSSTQKRYYPTSNK